MKKIIKLASIVAVSLFGLITLYDLLFNGWFEPASMNVWWWDVGAGTLTTTIRFFLVPIVTLCLIIMAFLEKRFISRLCWLLVIPIVVATFIYSTSGIERYSENFIDSSFRKIISDIVDNESTYTQEDILRLIGEPLVKENNNRDWLYSYMPSSGWGWNKRSFHFDEYGDVDSWSCYSEP